MRRAVIAAVLLAAAAIPQAASAHSLVRPGGALVSYLSEDATSLNTLTVRQDGSRIEFHDPTVDGGIDPGSCAPGAVAGGYIVQVFCPAAGVQRVRLDLREREDTAVVSVAIAATLLGGPGADRLTAGPAADEVSGGEGDDALDGGDGDDALDGGLGKDAIAGGAGADRVLSRDGLADVVRCGEGSDQVDADTVDEVDADCESVARTFTPPPSGSAGDKPGPPAVDVGAPTVQRPGASRRVRVYATSSEPGAISASGFLKIGGISRPVKAKRERVDIGGEGVVVGYRIARKRWSEARRALERGRRVAVRLRVVATDLAGNTSERRAPKVRLVRQGAGGKGSPDRPIAARHPEPGDADGDGIFDYPPYPPPFDNCPAVKNGSQVNTDGDAEGDACDADDDNDGIADAADNCRIDANPGQEDTDGDGYGDVCPRVDTDSDGLIDDDDNCREVANAEQQDLDGDDKGDVCDRDDDGDKMDDGFDNCPTAYNPPESDVDGDGKVTWRDQPDRDRDGIGTACDPDETVIGGPSAEPDRTPPGTRARAARRHSGSQLRAGVIVRVDCTEACEATAELVVSKATARRLGLGRNRTLGGDSTELDAAGSTYAFVRVGARARRALFREQRAIRARLAVGVVDQAGNPSLVERRVALGP